MVIHSSASILFPTLVPTMIQLHDAIAVYINLANPMSPQQQRHLKLAHAAVEHALYFLEVDDQQRATAYLQYASQQFHYLADSRCSA